MFILIGQTGLLKSYGLSSSVAKDRQKATVFIAGGNAMGMICGPCKKEEDYGIYQIHFIIVLQMAFTTVNFDGYYVGITSQIYIKLSLFTAPPLFASVINLALILTLVCHILCKLFLNLA